MPNGIRSPLQKGSKFTRKLIAVELQALRKENRNVQSFCHSERMLGALTILGLLHERILAQLPENERVSLSLESQLIEVGHDIFEVNEKLEREAALSGGRKYVEQTRGIEE